MQGHLCPLFVCVQPGRVRRVWIVSENVQQQGYCRYPTIAGDRIVFVADDDLWVVSDRGGTAQRLTTALSRASMPSLSPDGRWIAFVAAEDGPTELYVMPSEGGAPRKLTHLGGMTVTSGWHPDGHILFTSDAESPFAGWRFPYRIAPNRIAPTGGEPEKLPWGPANFVAVNPGGGIVLNRNARDPAYWKRYRGGTAGHFWVDPDGKSGFVRWTEPNGNLVNPMWIGGRIYFLSDHEGVGNLYSALPDGSDLRRHTDHETYYARNAKTDGRRIVYHAGGDIYLYDPETDVTERVAILLPTTATQRARRFVDAAKYLESVDLHPQGHSLLATVRGRLYSFGNWEGPVLEHGESKGTRYRKGSWLTDGKRVVCVVDAGDQEVLEIHDAEGAEPPRRIDSFAFGHVCELTVAPKGKRAAVINHRNQVLVIELETEQVTVVEDNPYGRPQDLAWSPDGTWLAYASHFSRQTIGLKLWRSGEQPVRITDPVLYDVAPAFDPGGKYLYFLSYRVFNPVYDDLRFDLGFYQGVKPCLITLQADTPSPFLPEPRPLVENGKGESGNTKDGKDDAADEKDEEDQGLRIDLDEIADRVLMFPVPEARYRAIQGIDGKVLFLSTPVAGVADSASDRRPKGTLHVYDLKNLKYETLAQGVTGFGFTFDRKTMVLRYDRRLRVLPAGKKPEDKPGEGDTHSRETGWINLGRIKAAVQPDVEWAQMLREAWRLQRDHFWTEDLSGVDWDAVWERYSRLLPRIATRDELSDLMWEMQGELGTSHAYEMGGDYRQGPNYGQGFLGASFTWDAERGGYRIVEVVKGDSWADDSSLRLPGVRLRVGDVLLAIDNRRLSPELPPAACLVGKAGQEVALRVVPADGGDEKTVTVKALGRAGDKRARYRAWVEGNRKKVHEASGGRLGYVHVPDMGGVGFAEFYRSWLAESERDGLIVDVRHNGGGHVSSLLLEKLARRAVGFCVSRWYAPETYPENAVLGPIVAITNERAGSDGDIFSHAFKLMELGPLIGKRTWGGVIGIWPRHHLVDGSVTTQPEYAFWFPDVEWGVENYGTDPDIEVDDRPEEYAAGVDAQLERAIAEAMARLEANPPAWPAFDNRPSRALPELPARRKDTPEAAG